MSDVIANTGTISTQNLVPAGVATPLSAVELEVDYSNTMAIQTVGVYTGALSLQGTNDGQTWVTIGGIPLINRATGASAATIASATQGIFETDVTSFQKVRVTALAAVTGSVVVTLKGTTATGIVSLGNPLPAGAAALGSVTVTSDTPAPGSSLLLTSAATTNATSTKATAGNLFEIAADNMSAAIEYLKLYNKASAPTVGTDVPILTIPVPANGQIVLNFGALGLRFPLGIAFATTLNQPVADATAIAAGDMHISGTYI